MIKRLVFLVVALTTLHAPVLALSQDQSDLYSSGVYYFDSNGTAAATCSTLNGNSNGIKAYNFFTGKGLTPAAASGIVGNMTEESVGVEPERLQGDFTGYHPAETLTPDQLAGGAGGDSIGWGIVQFTPPSKYVTLSHDSGVSYDKINSLGYQLAFVWHNVQSNSTIINDLNGAPTPEIAAEKWRADYERGNPDPTREAYARAYYNLATQNTPLPPSVPVSNTDAGNPTGGVGCGGYQNPFRSVSGLGDAGIDAGVDLSGDGDVYALGDGTIVYISDSSGWEGHHAVAYTLSDGPAQGKTVYIAENCPTNTSLSVGSSVTPDTVVCHMNNAYPFIETGWATADSDTPKAYDDNCYYLTNPNIGQKTSTAYGINFDQLLVSLGVVKGSLLAPPVTCDLPSGWPQWPGGN